MKTRPVQFKLFWRTYAGLTALVGTLGGLWVLAVWALADSQRSLGESLAIGTASAALTAGLIAWMTSLINRPIEALSQAAERLREGDLDSRLDEAAVVQEIREVNAGFNRMARELARVEQDRAVMLAGISHDLRTPLARLRLEAEMSVANAQALAHMAQDIDQLDAIIDKFTEYAHPEAPKLRPVDVPLLLRELEQLFSSDERVRLHLRVPQDLWVWGDATDLRRALVNLVENAGRYARGADDSPASVTCTAQVSECNVILCVSDQGPGVPPDHLERLIQPFFRSNAARTEATGAGLGLAIVDKTVQRMRGELALSNLPTGGLQVCITLALAEARATLGTEDTPPASRWHGPRPPAPSSPQSWP